MKDPNERGVSLLIYVYIYINLSPRDAAKHRAKKHHGSF
jgi:hypothetical protein